MTARPQSPQPGIYHIPRDIPELGVSAGDFLNIMSADIDDPYAVIRLVSQQVMEAILSNPEVRPVTDAEWPDDEWGKPHTVEPRNMEADEIDVDALLANATIVKEPYAGDLLTNEAWLRWIRRRDDRGHRVICPDCNTAFIRDMNKVRRCRSCRMSFPRDCIGCGEHFDAHHFMVKRCPPCRAKHYGVRCDTCNEYFVRHYHGDRRCDGCEKEGGT